MEVWGMLGLLLINDFRGFFIVYSTIDSTAHSTHLNSLEHCKPRSEENYFDYQGTIVF